MKLQQAQSRFSNRGSTDNLLWGCGVGITQSPDLSRILWAQPLTSWCSREFSGSNVLRKWERDESLKLNHQFVKLPQLSVIVRIIASVIPLRNSQNCVERCDWQDTTIHFDSSDLSLPGSYKCEIGQCIESVLIQKKRDGGERGRRKIPAIPVPEMAIALNSPSQNQPVKCTSSKPSWSLNLKRSLFIR